MRRHQGSYVQQNLCEALLATDVGQRSTPSDNPTANPWTMPSKSWNRSRDTPSHLTCSRASFSEKYTPIRPAETMKNSLPKSPWPLSCAQVHPRHTQTVTTHACHVRPPRQQQNNSLRIPTASSTAAGPSRRQAPWVRKQIDTGAPTSWTRPKRDAFTRHTQRGRR